DNVIYSILGSVVGHVAMQTGGSSNSVFVGQDASLVGNFITGLSYSLSDDAFLTNFGDIWSRGPGVTTDGSLTATNTGRISGTGTGISASGRENGMTVTLNNSGDVIGTGSDGMNLLNISLDLDNSGLIQGGRQGISFSDEVRNGSLSVANSGQIRGTTEEGIYSTDNGIVTNSGEISGSDGIHFDNKGAFDDSDATVVNKASGVITSTTPFGSALRLTGYSLDLNNAGEVTGGASGVFLTGSTAPADPLDSAFILNSGRISALSDTAIFVSEATLELTNTGQIDGNLGVLQTTLNDSTGQGEITNSGTISGWRAEGVFMDSPGIVTNSGEIWGVDAVHFESGVGFSNTSATLVNSSTGLIASNDTNGRGLYSERLSLDLNNAGEIIGGGNAIYVEGTQGLENPANTAELQNTGLISSTDATAVFVFDATLNLTNDGVISGDLGVFHSNSFVPTGPAQVFNSGTIIGTGGEGLELLQSATVENTGTIRGATAAIEGGDEKNALINSGDIVGSIVFKNGADTITNTG
ncbi:MAG: hypothetical protein HRU32_17720, partial [Rhodobacteraceae bacterium]|nr:hypothetical protein [Paracoccaceae bacterium]